MYYQTTFRSLAVLTCLLSLAAYAGLGGYFARDLVVEIAILAIVAVSLDVVAGFGGMNSLCHGALMGTSAYCYSALTAISGVSPGLSVIFALGLTVIVGLSIGFITARTTGIFLIMATLAFGQLAYTVVFRADSLGGDDGLSGVPRLDLQGLGIDLGDSLQFALFALFLLAFVYAAAAIAMRSSFGRMLAGVHSNETRLTALGVNVREIKTVAFGFSALLAGFAGIVAAQHTQFVSPELLFWTVSGEILIVVILGGLGTLAGPVVGAALFVLVKHGVGKFTSHWPMIVGMVLIATVLAGGEGLFGAIESRLSPRQIRKQPSREVDVA